MRTNMFIRKKITKGLAAAGLFLCLFLTAVPVHAEEPATVASQTETAAEAKEETPDETPAKAEDITIDFVEKPEEKPSKNSGKK